MSAVVLRPSGRVTVISPSLTSNRPDTDEDYKQAATLAALAAPYRHARLSAMKLAGDPNNPMRVFDNASADELRAETMRRIAVLRDAGLIDLEALPVPEPGIAN